MNTHILARFAPIFRREPAYAETIGWVSFALALLTGATSTPFAKQLSGSFSPLSMVFLSEFSVLCFAILSFGFLPLLRSLRNIRAKHLLPLLCFSLMNGIAAPMMVFHGLEQTTAIKAELYLRSQTLFLLLIAAVFLKEKIRKEHLLAASVVITGIVVVALRGFTSPVAIGTGELLILGGSAIYATGTSIMKRIIHATHPEAALFFRGTIALSFFFISSPFLHHTFMGELTALDPSLFGTVIGYGFLACFLSMFCFYDAVERLEAHVISVGLPLMSIGSILFANAYLGERLMWYHLVGALLLVSGTIMMRMADRKHGNAKSQELLPHYQKHA